VSSKVAEGTVDKATLTFTTVNFATPQTVTVTGINDILPDGDAAYSINLGKSTSTDLAYKDLEGKVDLTNTDDDSIAEVQAHWSGYCARFVDGRVKCWGRNDQGALGLGDVASRGDGANEMGDALPFLNFGAGRTVKALASGNRPEAYHCAILDNDSLKCWGRNDNGQLGYQDLLARGDAANEMGDNLLAVNLGAGRTVKQAAVANAQACAILDDNTLKCWGFNGSGQLGLGDTLGRGFQANSMGAALPAVALGAGRTAKFVAGGNNHTCAILDNNTVKCWGVNGFGQLGLGDTIQRGDGANEMGDALPALTFGAGRTVKTLGVGADHACALLDNNTVKCWGANNDGRLGVGDTANRGDGANEMGDALPALDFGAGRTVKQLAVGHTENCALLDNDTVKCWGLGQYGQLGQGNGNNLGTAPAQMGANLPTINFGAGRTAKVVHGGTYGFCATLDNGALKCWGYNSGGWGALGLGDQNNRGDNGNEMGDTLPAVKLIGP
jgi:E3 ubiquitin-protein ligase HERC3